MTAQRALSKKCCRKAIGWCLCALVPCLNNIKSMALSLTVLLLVATSAVFFLVATKAARWLRAFLYLRHRLPCSERAKSLLSPTGDLANMNTPDRHRVVTALAEQFGPVFYLRALWLQASNNASQYISLSKQSGCSAQCSKGKKSKNNCSRIKLMMHHMYERQ